MEEKYISPEIFLTAWYLKKLDNTEVHSSFLKNFFEVICYGEKSEEYYLDEMLKRGFISELELSYKNGEKENIIGCEYVPGKLLSIVDKNTFFRFSHLNTLKHAMFSVFPENEDPSEYISYSLETDINKINIYIQRYSKDWEKDELIPKERNILKSEKQIKSSVSKIFQILKGSPERNLLFSNERFIGDSDPWMALYYLEILGDIETKDFVISEGTSKHNIYLRIDILPKFYSDFKELKYGDVEFNFETLIT